MKRLLVSGVGFHPEKITEPAKRLAVEGILLVYGRHTQSEIVEADVRSRFPQTLVRSTTVDDWNLQAITKALKPAVSDALDLLGGPRFTRPVVNLTAGHGFLLACLSQFAWDEGLEMALYHESKDRLLLSSHYAMGSKPLRKRSSEIASYLMKNGRATPRELGSALGMSSSSLYNAVHILEQAGIIRQEPGGTSYAYVQGALGQGPTVAPVGNTHSSQRDV